jgi:ectoine hydroxylase-related dioxygenase (phytanoyl-CoA dioxygenase family)
MNDEGNSRDCFVRHGFLILREFLPLETCDQLAAELTARFEAQQGDATSRIGGVRNLLQSSPLVAAVAKSDCASALLRALLDAKAFPVRSIFFDKTPEANWNVAWHQDLHIAVAERVEAPGYGPWSVKAGVPHVQPPPEVLSSMATIRIHLDDCDAANGALRVVPGSHAAGILARDEFNRWKEKPAVVAEVPKGGALVMSPLLLHSSSAAVNPSHRRVLHLEYASCELPAGLRWSERT